MLFARAGWAVVAHALVAALFLLRSSATPWRDAEPWFPVYGTLIDAGCLALLWPLTRREGIGLFDLIGFERARLGRDALLALAIVPASLLCILAGVYAAGLVLYGAGSEPYLFSPLPGPATLYAGLVFPVVWGFTEQTTYNGYVLPRLRVLSGSPVLAVAAVALVWSAQHAVMPLTFDGRYMAFRLLSSVPNSLFFILVYLRLGRLVPLIAAHALLDGGSVLAGVLLGGAEA
ncbi:MAG TPA: CPBP family glutamic-type intramembrane protease [Longimicrobiales bacterium]|nr:CPBP family glutamic-type intramembrane protease [Longimicrobiales bacterium]